VPLPGAGAGGTGSVGDLADAAGVRRGGARGLARRRQGPGDRDHQSARDGDALGSRQRRADRPRDRLAGSKDRRSHRAPSRRRARSGDPGEDGTRLRSVLLGEQGRVAARSRPGGAVACRAGRTGDGHRRHLAALEPHRGARPRHRSVQREPDAVVEPRTPVVGRRPARTLPRAASGAPDGRRVRRRVRSMPSAWRRPSGALDRGRSAGRARGAALQRTRRVEDDLRHRLLPAGPVG
jgi:hypothetical protein